MTVESGLLHMVEVSRLATCQGASDGLAASTNPATPATNGEAALVPANTCTGLVFAGSGPMYSPPGPKISTVSASLRPPYAENEARLRLLLFTAPTQTTPS